MSRSESSSKTRRGGLETTGSQAAFKGLELRVVEANNWDLVLIERTGLIEPGLLAAHPFFAHFRPRRPVIIYGNGPAWLYGRLIALASGAPWVACGSAELGAVVIRSRVKRVAIGKVVPPHQLLPYLKARAGSGNGRTPVRGTFPSLHHRRMIAIVGPPHSGKTVFLSVLHDALEHRLGAGTFYERTYFVSGNPDGEGKWSQRLPADVAEFLRRKDAFTMAFALSTAERLRRLASSKQLVVTDLGGRVDGKQLPILQACTHVLIVSRSSDAISEWSGAAALVERPVVAIVESSREPTSKVVGQVPLRCRIGPFDRGAKVGPALPSVLLDAVLGDLFPERPAARAPQRAARHR